VNKNQIARNCALRLFTMGGTGETVKRLALISDDGRVLGGWGITPVMNVIADEIEAERIRERKARRKKAELKEANAKS
jgi:hypothetical protein